jgi:hypothetical protein
MNRRFCSRLGPANVCVATDRDAAAHDGALVFACELELVVKAVRQRPTHALKIISAIGSNSLCRKDRTFHILRSSCSFSRFARRPLRYFEPILRWRRSPQLEEATTCE